MVRQPLCPGEDIFPCRKLILIQSFQESLWEFFFLRKGLHIAAFQGASCDSIVQLSISSPVPFGP